MINDYDCVSDIYDIYNTSDYDINFYLQRYKDFSGKAVELMAGTGRLAIPLLKSGIKLDCIDISFKLLEKLKNKILLENLHSNIINSDIRHLNLDYKYDLVIIAFNSFSEIIDDNDQELVFSSVKNILQESGEFIFTLYNPLFRRKSINNNLTFINEYNYNGNKMLFFISSSEDNKSIVDIRQFYEIYDNEGNFINKKVLNLKFRLITKNEIENLIVKTGFRIKELYGNFDLKQFDENESPFMIYILSK